MATLTVLYPSGEMDVDYYLNKHVPLVREKWTGHGLLGYEIIMFAPDQPFQLQATLRFDSIESIVKAPTEDIMADIKNYTALEPISVAGQTTALETF